jgi:hypothetical protein
MPKGGGTVALSSRSGFQELLDGVGYLCVDMDDAREGYVQLGIVDLAAPRHVRNAAFAVHAHYFVEAGPPFDPNHLTHIRNFLTDTAGLDDRRNVGGAHNTPQTLVLYTRRDTPGTFHRLTVKDADLGE